jgi:hypothetical protein
LTARGAGERERDLDREAELYEALRPRLLSGDALRVYDLPLELDRESRLLRTGERERVRLLERREYVDDERDE